VQFFHTRVSERALDLAADCLRSTFLSEGARVREFEERLAAELGLLRPVAVNSGTSALHLALVLSGVGPGSEVILPAQTFVATGLAILMQGATPVFADIDPGTGNIRPEAITALVTDRTRAIMPVHWAGYPCDLDEIEAIAHPRGIAVIEDAAHALGATYRGRPIGSISRFTAFSFQAIKHLTTGDGGALCSVREADADAARTRRWFGIDRASSRPSLLGERVYDIAEVGYKYHLNDMAAAVGLGNLETFDQVLRRVRAIATRYRAEFSTVAGLGLLDYRDDRESACWLFTVRVERRDDFVRALQARGVPTSVVHQRIDRNSVFGGVTPGLTGQQTFDREQIAVPLHAGLTDDDVDTVVSAVRSGW